MYSGIELDLTEAFKYADTEGVEAETKTSLVLAHSSSCTNKRILAISIF
jgi:hypothetical protein